MSQALDELGMLLDRMESGEDVQMEELARAYEEALRAVERDRRADRTREATLQLLSRVAGSRFVGENGEWDPTPEQWKAIGTEEYKRAFHRYLRNGFLGLSELEQRTMNVGADPDGGFLVPPEFAREVLQRKPMPTSYLGRVRRLTIGANEVVFPRVTTGDDIFPSSARVRWQSEIPGQGETTLSLAGSFGATRIPTHTMLVSVPVTNNLIEDAVVDVVGWVQDQLVTAYQLELERVIAVGHGSGQPRGITTAPGVPTITYSGGTLNADNLIAHAYALPAQYHNERTTWWLNFVPTGRVVRQLKDADGRYVIGDANLGLQGPLYTQSLLGYDVSFTRFLPTTPTHFIVFGDPHGYLLVERVSFSVQVLRELYAEQNLQVVLFRARVGGDVIEPWKFVIGTATSPS